MNPTRNRCLSLTHWATGFLAPVASGGLILAATLSVTNVRASQRAGTKLVDIYYDLAGSGTSPLTVSMEVSADGGATWGVAANTFLAGSAVGAAIQPGLNKYAVWNVGADWAEQFTSKCRVRVTGADNTAPSGMALIPGGEFTMGDTFNEGSSDERPTHTVEVSALYMDRTEVTLALWREVRDWGIVAGYTFDDEGLGKGLTHPVHTVSWYDAVKWCNARSRQENRTPAYYTDAGLTQEYKTGQAAPYVRWNTGYRLPTEAEWEKAARGGLSGKRFPWGDTISHSQANYCSSADYVYDKSGSRDIHPHPSYRTGGLPLSNPVGAFPWNGYELHDMAGNVWEWCWDWYGLYSSGSQTNPRGAGSGSGRVIRGGSWGSYAKGCQVSLRIGVVPSGKGNSMGFRSVLPPRSVSGEK